LKSFLVIIHDLRRGWGVTDDIKADPRLQDMPVGGRALVNQLVGKDTRMDHQSRGLVSQLVCEAQRGHCALEVGVVIVTPQVRIKWIGMITHIIKGAPAFSGAHS